MTYILDVPVDGGGRLLVEAPAGPLPDGLELAAPLRPGEVVARARASLEDALDQLKPAIEALHARLRDLAPSGISVEFGLTLGAEAGLVVARGHSEVHFAVTLSWEHGPDPAGT
jgi:hypothetical protein